MRSRKQAREEAAESAEALIRSAVRRSGSDLALAEEQAESARRLLLKFNVRLGYESKRFFCHGCKKLIVPGVNSRVRLNGSRLLLTCGRCGYVNRKIIKRP